MGRLFWFFKRRVTGSCSALKSGRRKDVLDMFFFSFYCDGLRFSDILTLEWVSIDMDAQLLRKCQYKTRQEVTVPLSPTAMDILRRWSGRRQRFVFRLLDPQTDMTDQKSLYAQRMSKTRSQNGVLCRIGKELNLNVSCQAYLRRKGHQQGRKHLYPQQSPWSFIRNCHRKDLCQTVAEDA